MKGIRGANFLDRVLEVLVGRGSGPAAAGEALLLCPVTCEAERDQGSVSSVRDWCPTWGSRAGAAVGQPRTQGAGHRETWGFEALMWWRALLGRLRGAPWHQGGGCWPGGWC